MSRRKHHHPSSTPQAHTRSTAPNEHHPAVEVGRAQLERLRAQIEDMRREFNARLDALAADIDHLLAPAPIPPAPPPSPALPVLRPGDAVYIPRLGGAYRVLEVAPNGQTFKVQSGAVRVQVRRDEIWPLDEKGAEAHQGQTDSGRSHGKPDFNAHIAEIDLHGYSEEHATITLEYFLHHAYAEHIPRVRIIHGKGNGILRAAVRRELARNPLVKGIDTGPQYRGDDGVTLADLDL